jgi:hypothetical protein
MTVVGAESPSGLRSRAAPSRPDTLYHIVLLALSACIVLLSVLLSIRGSTQVVLPLVQVPLPELCTFRRFVGLDCPGCGLTRSFISLAHGEVAAAWSYNPAGLLLFAIVVVQIPFRVYQLWRIRRGQRELSLPLAAQIIFAVLGIALVAQWSLRLAGIGF